MLLLLLTVFYYPSYLCMVNLWLTKSKKLHLTHFFMFFQVWKTVVLEWIFPCFPAHLERASRSVSEPSRTKCVTSAMWTPSSRRVPPGSRRTDSVSSTSSQPSGSMLNTRWVSRRSSRELTSSGDILHGCSAEFTGISRIWGFKGHRQLGTSTDHIFFKNVWFRLTNIHCDASVQIKKDAAHKITFLDCHTVQCVQWENIF